MESKLFVLSGLLWTRLTLFQLVAEYLFVLSPRRPHNGCFTVFTATCIIGGGERTKWPVGGGGGKARVDRNFFLHNLPGSVINYDSTD